MAFRIRMGVPEMEAFWNDVSARKLQGKLSQGEEKFCRSARLQWRPQRPAERPTGRILPEAAFSLRCPSRSGTPTTRGFYRRTELSFCYLPCGLSQRLRLTEVDGSKVLLKNSPLFTRINTKNCRALSVSWRLDDTWFSGERAGSFERCWQTQTQTLNPPENHYEDPCRN
jgi:hypothetical protein